MTGSGTAPYQCMTCGIARETNFDLPCPKCGSDKGFVAKSSAQITPTVEVNAVAAAVADLSVPEILKAALLTFERPTDEGQLVAAVGGAWLRILDALLRDPAAVMRMTSRQWEEFLAGCYDQDGYDVILTPTSADLGRDIIATKPGVGSIRILDQAKRYKPGHLVTHEEVRAFLFVAQADKASKAFMTTTSGFAPNLMKDRLIAPHVPTFLELRGRDEVAAWLRRLAQSSR